MTIDKTRLDNRLGSVSAEDMRIIEAALMEQIGMGGDEDEQHHYMRTGQ